MPRLYIRGLVKLAEFTRGQLACPITSKELARLRASVADAIRMVNELLAGHGGRVSALPPPSRKAYLYLAGLDWASIKVVETPAAPGHLPASVSFKGLHSYFGGLLDDLAGVGSVPDISETFAAIRETSAGLKGHMERGGLSHRHLKPGVRQVLCWFAYFQERDNFDVYIAAVRAARPAMDASLQDSRRFNAPAIIQFRPMAGLYRIRSWDNGTRLHLPTPMISFDGEAFACLARAMFSRNGDRRAIIQRTAGAPYRAIRDELGRLSGEPNQVTGAFHDLATSFERVRASYFAGEISRPRLLWSRRVTGRHFGYYNHLQDTVMVSCTLDSSEVPAYVVDFVVYHELLHKKHGCRWRNGRQAFHTREFRREERRFEQYTAAEAMLDRLAHRYS